MGKPVPVGTMGLRIDHLHPALDGFNSQPFTTPQWYDIVTHADCAVLDDTSIRPIVQMIDNFERNHRLGILFECKVRTDRRRHSLQSAFFPMRHPLILHRCRMRSRMCWVGFSAEHESFPVELRRIL